MPESVRNLCVSSPNFGSFLVGSFRLIPHTGRCPKGLISLSVYEQFRATNQVVGSSNLSGRANKTWIFNHFRSKRDLWQWTPPQLSSATVSTPPAIESSFQRSARRSCKWQTAEMRIRNGKSVFQVSVRMAGYPSRPATFPTRRLAERWPKQSQRR